MADQLRPLAQRRLKLRHMILEESWNEREEAAHAVFNDRMKNSAIVGEQTCNIERVLDQVAIAVEELDSDIAALMRDMWTPFDTPSSVWEDRAALLRRAEIIKSDAYRKVGEGLEDGCRQHFKMAEELLKKKVI